MTPELLEAAMKKMMQIGVVVEADYSKKLVRVQFDGLKSAWLRWGVQRAGGDVSWWAPEVGEQVLVMFPYGDESQGIVVSTLYSDSVPAPASTPDKQLMKFKDGSTIEYDRAAKKLAINLMGDMRVDLKGTATIKVIGDATVDAASITLNGGNNGGVVCQQHVCAFTGSPHPQGSDEVSAT